MEYKITQMKNAFYAQSGGVTSVINTSAYGVISELNRLDKSINVYAGQNGIVGLLENNLYDLSKTKKRLKSVEGLSCRDVWIMQV